MYHWQVEMLSYEVKGCGISWVDILWFWTRNKVLVVHMPSTSVSCKSSLLITSTVHCLQMTPLKNKIFQLFIVIRRLHGRVKRDLSSKLRVFSLGFDRWNSLLRNLKQASFFPYFPNFKIINGISMVNKSRYGVACNQRICRRAFMRVKQATLSLIWQSIAFFS